MTLRRGDTRLSLLLETLGAGNEEKVKSRSGVAEMDKSLWNGQPLVLLSDSSVSNTRAQRRAV
jgi:hypothetical protein